MLTENVENDIGMPIGFVVTPFIYLSNGSQMYIAELIF